MMTVRNVDLVAPLVTRTGNPATDMRITDTAGLVTQAASGAVSRLTDCSGRLGDVDSANKRSTLAIQIMPGTRISTTATRTTTRITSFACEPSADEQQRCHADFSFEELVQAYLNCRQNKRNTPTALAFEQHLEANLCQLNEELLEGTYKPGRSICFVITRPKPREVWAAEFRDRIVHHLLYNRISPRFYAGFIADSCACIPGRGTLYGAKRLESKIRSITQNWSQPAHYLKLDLANFFVSIDKHVVRELLAKRVSGWWLQLAELILFTGGEFFFSAWCRQCERDKSMREGCDIDECDDNERCDIIANTMCFDVDHEKYPKEWQYGSDGQPCCTSFVPVGNSIPERCIYTLDMFEGTSI